MVFLLQTRGFGCECFVICPGRFVIPMERSFVSRGGQKLSAALDHFQIDISGSCCADLGSHIGGFVDSLLQRGAARVHSVDTAYGILAWKLRKDSRVVVHERTNALHFDPREPVDWVTIDVGWTRQSLVLASVAKWAGNPRVVTLVKPHYESRPDQLMGGVLPDSRLEEVVARVITEIEGAGWKVNQTLDSPIRGHGGNREVLALLTKS